MTWEQMLTYVYNYLTGVVQQIAGYIQTLVNQVWTILTPIITAIQTFIQNLWTQLSTAITQIVATIRDTFVNLVEQVWQWFIDIAGDIYETLAGMVRQVAEYIGDIVAWVVSLVEEAISAIQGFIGQVIDWVRNGVEQLVAFVSQALTEIGQAISSFFQPLLESLSSFLDAIKASIINAYDVLITGAQAVIAALIERLEQVSIDVRAAAEDLIRGVAEFGDEHIKPIREGIEAFMRMYVPKNAPADASRIFQALEGIHTDPQSMAVFRQFWTDGWREVRTRGPLYQTIFTTLMLIATLIPTLWGVSSYLSEQSVQEFRAQFPNEPLSQADAINAWRHGQIGEQEAIRHMLRLGQPEDQSVKVLKSSGTTPAPGELLAMWLRGIINDDALNSAFIVQGIDPPWQSHMRELTKVIPPISDLIAMAVHDVWNPAAVNLGRLFDGLPEELLTWAKKQGLSEDWARYYWGAHWSLPSPQQGFEMLHRGIIGEEALDTLLTALDIAPGWRDKLKGITYHNYTRVDIRRMHAAGVLNETEVTRAHLDLGYDENKAAKLTEFVLKLNQGVIDEEGEDLGRLSRTAILGFFRDGLLTEDRTRTLLVAGGATPQTAELWIASVKLAEESDERREAVALIIDQTVSGVITPDEAEQRIRGLGLETIEVERAMIMLTRALERRVKLPTQDDAEKLFLSGIIQIADYKDVLERLGFAPKWVTAYAQFAEQKRKKNA